jgi:hypothetical protein
MNINMPHADFNAAVKDGSAGHKMKSILQECQPEAVYFTERNGHRGATVIVEIDHVSQIPELAEPWYLNFNADVEFRIAMTPEDLEKAGLEELGKKWG